MLLEADLFRSLVAGAVEDVARRAYAFRCRCGSFERVFHRVGQYFESWVDQIVNPFQCSRANLWSSTAVDPADVPALDGSATALRLGSFIRGRALHLWGQRHYEVDACQGVPRGTQYLTLECFVRTR